ncbi:zinc finger MYM-type protein 1-like [Myzus persicae]|uniref:zinc finger MYM-type protein 1-like n=1 Tax=Myzus persicae TaxID=13164 RepID=UPI000B9350F4|nr:zinc finger MYM-type protein 1-like [Myzus persicae]
MPPKKDKPSGAHNSGTCETSTSTSDARNESINDIDENISKTPVKYNNETSTSTSDARNESINDIDENISKTPTPIKHNNEETLTSPTLTYFPCDDNNIDIDINSSNSALANKTVEISDKPVTDVSKSVAFISQPDLFDPNLWPDNRQNNFIDIVIKMGPREINDDIFPKDENNRHFSKIYKIRKLDNNEKVKRRWLVYSKSIDRVFCFCCKLFNSSHSTLSTIGNNDWKHMTTTLNSHEKSPEHFTAYKKWHECELRLKLGRCIDNDLQRVMNTEVQHWKSILERLISITLYLSKHNLAFRGSSDKLFERNNVNYLGLVELLGKYDNYMKEHLNRITTQKLNITYCSKDIQNELINLMASKVLETIQQKVQDAKYFSVILDCTPDVSHSEKMSFTIRFVDENNGNLQVAEHFIGFREVSESTGESLTELLLKTLRENKLDIMNCRGQGYDNGANMKGHKKGVQAIILALNPKAAFMPCGCHSLNLVISDAASQSKESITLFGIVQRIFVLFSASVYRWQVLKSHLPNLTVKPLCTTRWESRIDSVKAIRYQTKEVYDALIEVAESSKADAVYIVSKSMQGFTMDIEMASSLLDNCVKYINKYRETGYADASNSSKEIAESLGIDPIIKEVRVRRKKTFFDENNDQDFSIGAEERFKRDFFYTLVDTVRESIKEIFTQFENHKQLWGFLYNLEKLPSSEHLLACCKDLHGALSEGDSADINSVELYSELKHLSTLLPIGKGSPKSALQFIHDMKLVDVFPYTWISLRILLTIPVTVASGERSFSKLKLIKTYLRSSMTDDRLSSLAILSIENDLADKVNYEEAIKQFSELKARKVKF